MKLIFTLLALVLAACSTPAQVPVAANPADDTRPCAVVAKELDQVKAEMAELEPAAKKAEADNKNIRESLISKILVFQYLRYDAETVQRFEAMKKRKNDLELVLAGRCPA